MTHFTVMVVGDDVEGQLRPYDEDGVFFRETDDDPYEKLGVPKDADDKKIDEAFAFKTMGMDNDSDEWYELERAQRMLLDPGARREYDTNGPRPPSRWDWWQIGGRWQGYLLDTKGRPIDQGRKAEIDVAAMRQQAEDEARKWWERWEKVIAGTPRPTPWSAFIRRVEDPSLPDYTIERAREEYGRQPRVKKVDEWDRGNSSEAVLGFFSKPDDIPETLEEYVAQRRNTRLTTSAYVFEGKWHENGRTGWWGVTFDETMTQDEWDQKFSEWFDTLPDDTLITIVDCHV